MSSVPPTHIRNVAIIAHVDHGKTSLVDQLLYQSGMFRKEALAKMAGGQHGLITDSNDLERERGITILSKTCGLDYTSPEGEQFIINVIDTPGHADFGGEVERVLKMADGCLIVVDAYEGPMPQTRFVVSKALACGLKPILVLNKADREDADPEKSLNDLLELLLEEGADDDILDSPVIYSSAKQGWATRDLDNRGDDNNMLPIFQAIIDTVPHPSGSLEDPPTILVTTIGYSEFTGRIAVGRISGGKFSANQSVAVHAKDGNVLRQRITKVLKHNGLERVPADEVHCGDICAITGLDPIDIGDTITCPEHGKPLERLTIDEPTLRMMFRVNDSPFNGQSGQYLTSRQIKDRLERELQSDVALRMEPGDSGDECIMAGRGLMHLGILIENMRREGYELSVGKPRVIMKEVDGKIHEPIEELVVDCPMEYQSSVMSIVGDRRGNLLEMNDRGSGGTNTRLLFSISARALIGLRARLLTATQGNAIMHHTFQRYEPLSNFEFKRKAGVLVATDPGQVTAYALDALYDRGTFFVKPGDPVYEGQVVGEHCKDKDLAVNVVKTKQLTNIRAASKDDGAKVKPARIMSLEVSLEYVEDDELVEVTPDALRLRKRLLKEGDRRRESKKQKAAT